MSPFEVVAILLAGVAAGTINTVVGGGTRLNRTTPQGLGGPPGPPHPNHTKRPVAGGGER